MATTSHRGSRTHPGRWAIVAQRPAPMTPTRTFRPTIGSAFVIAPASPIRSHQLSAVSYPLDAPGTRHSALGTSSRLTSPLGPARHRLDERSEFREGVLALPVRADVVDDDGLP